MIKKSNLDTVRSNLTLVELNTWSSTILYGKARCFAKINLRICSLKLAEGSCLEQKFETENIILYNILYLGVRRNCKLYTAFDREIHTIAYRFDRRCVYYIAYSII